jgi:hypothetical protein
MSSLLLPRRFYNQPQGAVTVDSNGIGSGLMVAFNAALPHINLANGQIETQGGGTGISRVIGTDGQRIALTGSGTGKHTFPIHNESDEITLITSGNVTGADTLDRFYSNYNGAGAPGRYDVYFDGGEWIFQAFASTTSGQWKLITFGSGTLNGVSVFRYKFGATPSLTVNGVAQSFTVIGTLSGSQPAANGIATCFGRPDVTTRQPAGNFLFQYAWNRLLTDSEVAAISDNPYQIFKVSE